MSLGGGPAASAAAWRAYISDVKAALPLGETIERLADVRFQRSGSRLKGKCPFHEDRTPSLVVREDRGLYRCFGAGCGAGGDVVQFVKEWFGVEFREALLRAGELAGLPPPDPGESRFRKASPADAVAWKAALPRRNGRSRVPEIQPIPAPASKWLAEFPEGWPVPKQGEAVDVLDDRTGRRLSVRPSIVHEYKSPGGAALCHVLRVDKPDGGKFFIQAGFPRGSASAERTPQLRLMRFPPGIGRPVYGMEDLPRWIGMGGSRILLVEGEKTRDSAAQLAPLQDSGILALSNMGGGNAAGFADWSPLAEALGAPEGSTRIRIAIWPDADRPLRRPNGEIVDRQRLFAESSAAVLSRAVSELCLAPHSLAFSRIVPPRGVKPGWDLADASAEGWSARDVLRHMDEASLPMYVPEPVRTASAPVLRPSEESARTRRLPAPAFAAAMKRTGIEPPPPTEGADPGLA